MFIKFENVPTEIIALAIAADEERDQDFANNCTSHINPDQWITVEGATLLISGQRCALWSDWYAPTMEALKASGLQPVEYETSDERLRWNETLESYMDSRATAAEALAEAKKHLAQRGYMGSAWGRICALASKARNVPYGTPAYRRANAEGTLPSTWAYAALTLLQRSGYDAA